MNDTGIRYDRMLSVLMRLYPKIASDPATNKVTTNFIVTK
jgi:hypothetical protein